ncbi:MAG TPA: glyoxalase/bleomycin resistance/dioxygenase family protein [Methanobacterium subterraneum]|uniref:Glyoxalase/bleomycin resistance/dioxygenase family protein n=1 Tax=Methanobacterium subterraneum TaxID=59277 RepID=A0A7J4TJX9_9EURY|nr:glyoxalase/bleomycin resistance/dioxygenase family protein [Methanobacterium subterraneum]
MNYICPLIAVADIQKSRQFYEKVLEQEVEMDHGANVAFKGGFAIHDAIHYQGLLGEIDPIDTRVQKNFLELYFESEDLDSVQDRLDSINTKFLHRMREQPWGQRVMRFYDPDGYIIEVGEPLEFVVRRFAQEGFSPEEVSQKSSMPLEFVEMVLDQK